MSSRNPNKFMSSGASQNWNTFKSLDTLRDDRYDSRRKAGNGTLGINVKRTSITSQRREPYTIQRSSSTHAVANTNGFELMAAKTHRTSVYEHSASESLNCISNKACGKVLAFSCQGTTALQCGRLVTQCSEGIFSLRITRIGS